MNKIVLYPIEVPTGKYCWEKTSPHRICQYFDNEGGHPSCKFGFYEQKDTPDGVLKPKKCLNLKTIKGKS